LSTSAAACAAACSAATVPVAVDVEEENELISFLCKNHLLIKKYDYF